MFYLCLSSRWVGGGGGGEGGDCKKSKSTEGSSSQAGKKGWRTSGSRPRALSCGLPI
jgi:hypothetical protein